MQALVLFNRLSLSHPYLTNDTRPAEATHTDGRVAYRASLARRTKDPVDMFAPPSQGSAGAASGAADTQRAAASAAPPGPRPASPQLSPMAAASAHAPPSLALSPMMHAGGGSGAAAAAAGGAAAAAAPPNSRALAPFNFSQGHGALSVHEKVKKNKTEIRPSAVESLNEQRAFSIPLKEKIDLGGGPLDVEFVPRRSNPAQFRAIATKTGGGAGGQAGLTSFPMGLDKSLTPARLATAGLKPAQLVHEPNSPRAASAAAAVGAAGGAAAAVKPGGK